ncbi:MAG: hypothetical protein KTR31_25140 [Myxococcales bacterium]|nr:hypothetical protein [Myxococcales bacterium]
MDADADTDADTDTDTDADTDVADTDTDLDGLTDPLEASLGTDPNDPDTDGDGLLDGAEVDVHGTDPLSEDTDGDGLSDGDEVDVHGTDPLEVDTDSDRLSDAIEVERGTDPNVVDSDGDGLWDGDEVLDHETDPLLVDTDGDGVDDDVEIDIETNPTRADTDADGVTDGDELKNGTDPTDEDSDDDNLLDGAEIDAGSDALVPDTDADGLLDGDEVLVHGSSPLLVDTDADGLDDADEVLVHGTDPADPDTDADGLDDPDELTLGTDPLRIDSDDGGVPDGQEAGTDGTDPLDPFDDKCLYPDVSVDDPAWVPPADTFHPTFANLDWQFVSDYQGVSDYGADLDDDGVLSADENFAAFLRVELFGPEWDYLCAVEYDADTVTPVAKPSWTPLTPSGGPSDGVLVEGFELTPSGGSTDCPALDPVVYGTNDIRALLAGNTYGLALGDLAELQGRVKNAVDATGPTWVADWSTRAYGAYVTWDDTEAILSNYARIHDTVCELVPMDGFGDTIAFTTVGAAPLPPGLVSVGDTNANPTLVEDDFVRIYLPEITDIECPLADLDLVDIDFEVDSKLVMAADLVAVDVQLVPMPDGEIRDFYWDSDGDGTAEAFSARVSFTFIEGATEDVTCVLDYEADIAEVLDSPGWNALDVNFGASGPIWRAWELELTDPSSKTGCGSLDVKLGWSESDPEVLAEGLTFGFGVGQMNDLSANLGPALFPKDWVDIEPSTYALYITIDGTDAFEARFARFSDLDDCFELDPTSPELPGAFASTRRVGLYETWGGYVFLPL